MQGYLLEALVYNRWLAMKLHHHNHHNHHLPGNDDDDEEEEEEEGVQGPTLLDVMLATLDMFTFSVGNNAEVETRMQALEDEVDDMMRQGKVRTPPSPWAA